MMIQHFSYIVVRHMSISLSHSSSHNPPYNMTLVHAVSQMKGLRKAKWRSLMLARMKLKMSAKNAATLAGFTMVGFIELHVSLL